MISRKDDSTTRLGGGYLTEREARLQHKFSLALSRQRRYRWLLGVLIIGGPVALFVLGLLARDALSRWTIILVISCIFLIVVRFLITKSELKCPNCNEKLGHKLGSFCPECGSRSLGETRSRWGGKSVTLYEAQCSACKKTISQSFRPSKI